MWLKVENYAWYVNRHLAKFKLNCNGLDCVIDMYNLGGLIIQFDLKSAYHHIGIWPAHTK